MNAKHEQFREAIRLETEFQSLLEQLFGKEASVRRYQPRTWSPEVKAAWDACKAAYELWRSK